MGTTVALRSGYYFKLFEKKELPLHLSLIPDGVVSVHGVCYPLCSGKNIDDVRIIDKLFGDDMGLLIEKYRKVNQSKHTVFLIVGKTCSGKDTLVSYACKELQLKQLISYTTRPKRVHEGNTHIFIQSDEVEQYRKDIVAYTKIGEYEYFATEQQLQDIDFYIIDPAGWRELTGNRQLKEKFDFKTIFLSVSKDEQLRRAGKRKDKREVFIKRCEDENESFNDFEAQIIYGQIPGIIFDTADPKSKENFKNIISFLRK